VPKYEVIECLSDGLVGLQTPHDGKQLWVRAERMMSRRSHICIRCGQETVTEETFRPFGSPQNHTLRMCKSCVRELIDERFHSLPNTPRF
jgi:hypothetical protein